MNSPASSPRSQPEPKPAPGGAAAAQPAGDTLDFTNPPSTIPGILSRLGPGLIIAGSIVGSGELIATTKTGSEAGFWLLWLILIGCVIKVFVQVELGRDAIVRGKSTMDGLSEVPGPGVKGRGNWIIWYYLLMFLASAGQLGGIATGVGQALAITIPLTAKGGHLNALADCEAKLKIATAEKSAVERLSADGKPAPERLQEIVTRIEDLTALRDKLRAKLAADYPQLWAELAAVSLKLEAAVAEKANLEQSLPDRKLDQAAIRSLTELVAQLAEQKRTLHNRLYTAYDAQIWAGIVAVVTSFLLVVGRYKLIETWTTVLVAAFTLTTVGTVIALQFTATWAITWQDIVNGFSFRLPPPDQTGSKSALGTALATFGIIGVGATELVAYPYWCLEKGYARYTGKRDDSAEWGARARGWMNVLRWDAWCSMVVYTIATIAFYLLGAAILGRIGLRVGGFELVRTLTCMYEPVFGAWAPTLFLIGALAVLYSTFLVANAGHSRVLADALRVMHIVPNEAAALRRTVTLLAGGLPFLCFAIGLSMPQEPELLVLFSGVMQALMLPMLAGAALYFRYFRGDPRVLPTTAWDVFLWVSSAGMLIAAGALIYTKLAG